MGVAFRPGNAEFPYLLFSHFRTHVAAHEGINLHAMVGYGRPLNGENPAIPWDKVDTPIKPFLDHPDDRGYLSPVQCAQIAPRLREIVTALWGNAADLSAPGVDFRDHLCAQYGMALCDDIQAAADGDYNLNFR